MPRVQLNELGNLTDLIEIPGRDDLHGIVDEYRIAYSTTGADDAWPRDFPDAEDIRGSRLRGSSAVRTTTARAAGLLLVRTRFTLDARRAAIRIEVSRRIRNISPNTLWIYRVETQIDLRYFTRIRSSLNLNPPPERGRPPDHQADHCLGGQACPPPSFRMEAERRIYNWPHPEATSPFPVQLSSGREILARLTYDFGEDV